MTRGHMSPIGRQIADEYHRREELERRMNLYSDILAGCAAAALLTALLVLSFYLS